MTGLPVFLGHPAQLHGTGGHEQAVDHHHWLDSALTIIIVMEAMGYFIINKITSIDV